MVCLIQESIFLVAFQVYQGTHRRWASQSIAKFKSYQEPFPTNYLFCWPKQKPIQGRDNRDCICNCTTKWTEDTKFFFLLQLLFLFWNCRLKLLISRYHFSSTDGHHPPNSLCKGSHEPFLFYLKGNHREKLKYIFWIFKWTPLDLGWRTVGGYPSTSLFVCWADREVSGFGKGYTRNACL